MADPFAPPQYSNDFYERHKLDVHSQNGEDGVVAEILARLGVTGGWVVEAGAWDGVHLSNTFALLERGDCDFRALYVEGDPAKFPALEATAARLPAGKIVAVRAQLQEGADTLGDILQRHGVADQPALLSIDIDSHDYDVWSRLNPRFRPAVVVIEINSSVHPMGWQVHGRDGWQAGTSFLPMLLLGAELGYTLVAHTGNMVFVRGDLWPRLGLPLVNPLSHFRTSWLPVYSRR